jgi:alpha-L-rhamnosidase
MKKIFLTVILLFSIVITGKSQQLVSVRNLRCEYIHNPLGIDIPHPRLSWELSSEARNKKQKAYQILVSTDSIALISGRADVWDSRKTNSDLTNQIAYRGKPLQPNTLYFWKVRVWDEKGKPSEWSSAAHFFVGPLSSGDWKAQWIGEKEYAIHSDEAYYPFYGFRSLTDNKQDSRKWVIVDLGEDKPVDAVKLYPAYRRERTFPPRFSIEIASTPDFSSSKLIADESEKDVVVHPAEFYYKKLATPVTGRYIRLNITKPAAISENSYGYQLSEFEALHDMENLALNKPVSLSETTFYLYGWQDKLSADGKLLTDGHIRPNNLYHQYEDKIPASPLLRKEIQINKKIKNAFYTATAKGIYEAYINGEKVGNQVFAPEFTAYDKHLQYQTYEVGRLLKSGANALSAMLADGWYAGARHLAPNRGGYGYFRQFFAQLLINYEDGTSEIIPTDNTWKFWAQGPITEVSFFDGEIYDASKEPEGWDKPGFDDAHWSAPAVYPAETATLCAQMNEPIAVINELKPISVHKAGHNKYIFDMGQNMVGWCRLSLPYNPRQTLRLRYGEMIYADGTLYTDNLREAKPLDVYRPGNEAAVSYEPRFTYHGFRYVEVEGLTRAPELNNISGKVIASSSPVVGYFETSDKEINKLWENIRWTQWGNLISIPTDCPQRDERLGWMADAQIFSQTAIFNLDMAAFYTKWTRDIRDSQYEDGRFTDISPFDGLWACFFNSPGWADAGVIIPWRLYQNYNDTAILSVQYEAMKKFVDFNRENNPDLVWRNAKGGFGDWLNGNTIVVADDYPQTGAQIPDAVFSTAYFAYSTQLLANSAKLLRKEKDYKYYSDLAAAIRKVFVEKFVSADGKIEGDSQASYAMALQMGLVPDALRQKAAGKMVDAIKVYDYRLSTGFHTTLWLMNQLNEYGYTDVAYRLLTSHRFPSWQYSIDQGATTVWERWDGYVAGRGFQDPTMNSFNHVAFGSVGEWMYSHILGIQPDEAHPGYRHFYIRPKPGDKLEWAKGNYHSIMGDIEVSWTKKDGIFTLDVTVPVNTEATIVMPFGGKTVKVGSGKHRIN